MNKLNNFHVSWMIGEDENGAGLSTGKTYEAESMLEALATFHLDHPEVENPIYIAQI